MTHIRAHELAAHYSGRSKPVKARLRGLSESQARALTVGDRLVYLPTGATGTVLEVTVRDVKVQWANIVSDYSFRQMGDIRRA